VSSMQVLRSAACGKLMEELTMPMNRGRVGEGEDEASYDDKEDQKYSQQPQPFMQREW
jgi:hypothetical protein